jgi:hypothetical protein
MTIIIDFGIRPLKISHPHEFGDRKLKKLLRIDLLICTIFILDRGVFFQAAHAIRDGGREWVSSVRLARSQATKRGLAEGKNKWKRDVDLYRDLYEKTQKERDKLYYENHGLKIAIKAIGKEEQG